MKRNVLKPFVFIALLVLVVGMACGIDFGTKTQEPPPPAPVIQPTQQSEPIQQPTVVLPTQPPPPTATLPPPPSPFFKEEFDSDVLGDWTDFIITGDSKSDEKKAKFYVENGKLTFDLQDENLYSYLIFDKQSYEDVRVELSADNRGKNSNNISLICRYSNNGWYEFSVRNDGLFQIWAYDSTGAVHKGYNLINSGGSNAIKMGKETNVYAISCLGNHLALYINGEETASFTEKRFSFKDGKVGINVSSLWTIPVIVDIDYFDIQAP